MFFRIILLSSIFGYIFIAITVSIAVLLRSEKDAARYPSKTGTPLTLVFALIIVIGGIILNLPGTYSMNEAVKDAANKEYALAEFYGKNHVLDLSGYHYWRCYALCKTTMSYINLEIAYKDIWFYFIEADMVITEPAIPSEIELIQRKGFTLVEWGGMVD